MGPNETAISFGHDLGNFTVQYHAKHLPMGMRASLQVQKPWEDKRPRFDHFAKPCPRPFASDFPQFLNNTCGECHCPRLEHTADNLTKVSVTTDKKVVTVEVEKTVEKVVEKVVERVVEKEVKVDIYHIVNVTQNCTWLPTWDEAKKYMIREGFLTIDFCVQIVSGVVTFYCAAWQGMMQNSPNKYLGLSIMALSRIQKTICVTCFFTSSFIVYMWPKILSCVAFVALVYTIRIWYKTRQEQHKTRQEQQEEQVIMRELDCINAQLLEWNVDLRKIDREFVIPENAAALSFYTAFMQFAKATQWTKELENSSVEVLVPFITKMKKMYDNASADFKMKTLRFTVALEQTNLYNPKFRFPRVAADVQTKGKGTMDRLRTELNILLQEVKTKHAVVEQELIHGAIAKANAKANASAAAAVAAGTPSAPPFHELGELRAQTWAEAASAPPRNEIEAPRNRQLYPPHNY